MDLEFKKTPHSLQAEELARRLANDEDADSNVIKFEEAVDIPVDVEDFNSEK